MSNVKCYHCSDTFATKSRRNIHTIECHVLHVKIGK